MDRATVNGIECFFCYDERVSVGDAPSDHPFVYHVRHDEDDWALPFSVEPFVLANFFGTVFMRRPLVFGTAGYMEIEQFDVDHEYVPFVVSGSLFGRALGL